MLVLGDQISLIVWPFKTDVIPFLRLGWLRDLARLGLACVDLLGKRERSRVAQAAINQRQVVLHRDVVRCLAQDVFQMADCFLVPSIGLVGRCR